MAQTPESLERGESGRTDRIVQRRPAPLEHPIHPLLAGRWSPRALSPRSVEREKLARVLEAARWAPSCFNEQPWYFVVATDEDPEGLETLRSCLVPGNAWARRSPVLLLSVCRTYFEKSGEPNLHAWHDVGMATQNLFLQAVEEGLVAHAMAGFDREKAREACEVPPRFEPVAMIALGYPGAIGDLPENKRAAERAPRQRKPFRAFVFESAWGRAAVLPTPPAERTPSF